jgi:hypothetical protein
VGPSRCSWTPERCSSGDNYDGGSPLGTTGGIEAGRALYGGITPLLTSIGAPRKATCVPAVTKPHSGGETLVRSTVVLYHAYGSHEQNERTPLQLCPLVFPEFPGKVEHKALSFSLLLVSNNENNLAMVVQWPWWSCLEHGGASVFPHPRGHPGAAPRWSCALV